MPAPFYVQTLAAAKASGTLFNTYTTAKSVINVTDVLQVPGNYFQVGSRLRIRAWAGLSNIVTTPGTVVFQVEMGPPPTANIAVFSSGLIQMSTTANTLLPITLEIMLRLDSAGSGTAAKWMGGGTVQGLNVQLGAGAANGTVTDSIIKIPATSPAVGTGFDSTIVNDLDFFVGFSSSQGGNGIQIYDYTVEQLA